ncbi:MAG: GNAT family N-acetyltransferase [Defluviitaleaceae bacterium]|nr:GNAT family N-acetyltransferase [Defluviitaleaceae bacterium]
MVKNYNEVLYKNERMTTERLVLRKFEEGDATDILEYASDAETIANLIWEGSTTIEEAKANIYDFYWSRNGIWAIRHAESGKVIGCIDLRLAHDDDKATFGYVLNRNYWGHGYMTEALKVVLRLCFEQLKLNRVEANHFDGNAASGRVMEKAGMTYEGTARQAEKVKGVFRDCVKYGIIRDDYLRQK